MRNSHEQRPLVVAIDPGHGGMNTGTTEGGIIEKHYTLALAEKLAKVINCFHDWPIQAVLLRNGDVDMTQSERGKASRGADASLVISLHVNAYKDSKFNGLMTFYWPENTKGYEAASNIARSAPLSMRRVGNMCIRVENKGWLKDAYAIISSHRSTCVLVELGFATNRFDSQFLKDVAGQQALIGTLLVGVADYFTPMHDASA